MQEKSYAEIRAHFAEQARNQLQLVILHPHRRALGGDGSGGLCKSLIDVAVRLPPGVIVGGFHDEIVVERPQRRVGEPLVELRVVPRGQGDRVEEDVLVRAQRLGGGVGDTGPTDPAALLLFQHRGKARNEPAGGGDPLSGAIGTRVQVDRQPVGHHDEGVGPEL